MTGSTFPEDFKKRIEGRSQRSETMLSSATRRFVSRSASSARSVAVRNASTLVLADHNNATLNVATLNTVAAAKQIGGKHLEPVQTYLCVNPFGFISIMTQHVHAPSSDSSFDKYILFIR